MKPSLKTLLGGMVVLALAALFVRLGVWQLDRLQQRRAHNAAWARALALPPVTLDPPTVAALRRDPAAYVNRRARVSGEYAAGADVLLRGRVHQGQPGVHLVTPMVVRGQDAAVLVNRGWVPAPDAATADPRPFARAGARTVEGVLQALPATDDGGAPARVGEGAARALSLRRLDRAALSARAPAPLLPLYLQRLPPAEGAEAGPPYAVPLPALDEGSHLGYAVQWFSFAAIAVVGFALLVLRGRKARAG